MDLIVTHNNADFDGFSSLVAAKKLYPNSKLLMPGSQERAVREFLSLVKDKITVETERRCDLTDINRLVIVDTRHASRIGIAAQLLKAPSVEVHIYDHHPRTPYDIKGDKDVFQEVGATVSILIDLLRKRKTVKFTPLEATIMLIGVYEETGSLTYRTTTKLDVDTVSFLLFKGANLQAVSSYLNRKLTEEELTFLISLISSTKVSSINGINVAFSEGTIERFIGELGTIVRKLQDVENFPVLFVLFKMGKKIRIIARSSLKEVDVNKVLGSFGGGGHRSAASAKIEDEDIKAVRKKLENILKSNIKVRIFARDIMTRSVVTIPADKKIAQAKKMLDKSRLKGAPVTKNTRIIGMITMGDIQKALRYRYGHASVAGYMSRSVITIKPDTPIHVIQKIMFEEDIGRLPVLLNKKLMGIVTRTDVLKSVHRDIFRKHRPLKKKPRARFNISTKMKRVLPGQILKLLHVIGRLADNEGFRAFVVGGFVRDILLKVRTFDMDIVAEGDAISFGRKAADLLGGSLVAYHKFGTATVVMKQRRRGTKFKIDFATARKESYEKPAALPTVEFSSLKDDLQRRDFTINAMAASLNKSSFGQLIDFFGGEKDLENGVIRVLHDASFIDDPTRIFRAVRFEQRFDFRIDRYTEGFIKNAVREGMFSRTQHHRIRDELVLMLQEEEPIKAILRMKELHELRFIHKKIKVGKPTENLFAAIKEALRWYNKSAFRRRHIDLWLIYLAALMEGLNFGETKAVCEKFAFRRGDCMRLLSCKKNCLKALRALSWKELLSSRVYGILEPLSFEEILFIRAKTENKPRSKVSFERGKLARSRITDFFSGYNRIRIKIGGEDLKKLKIKPGPLYTKLLTRVLHKKIDGGLKTKKDELEYVKRLVRGWSE
ncbi:MAG: CBS domain-containing protein [Candidatus Omnitrophota bacterium]